MRMVGARVDLQLRDLLPSEAVLREHPLDRRADDLLRAPVELLAQRPAPPAPGIARVPVVALLVELVTGHLDLLGVAVDQEFGGVAGAFVPATPVPPSSTCGAPPRPPERRQIEPSSDSA